MTPCPECGGSGFVTLLVSRRPCKACAGREVVKPADQTAVYTSTVNIDWGQVLAQPLVNGGKWPP